MYSVQQILEKLNSGILLAAAFLLLTTRIEAQQQSVIPDEALDYMLMKFRKIQADSRARQQFEKELDASVDEATAKLDKWLLEQKKEQAIRIKNYIPGYKHGNDDMNLFPVWEEMPGPVPSLPEAKQTNFNSKYQVYIDKVSVMKKQLSDWLQQYLNDQRTGRQAIIQDSKAMADQNVMVQQMGGADALMKMSEKERKQAAQQSTENMKSNPHAATGMKNEGMNAMAQRMMTDPNYREAYNKMTDAQKEAELKKYMGNTIEERNDKAFETSINDRNGTYSAAHIELLLGKSLQQMQEAAKPYSEGTELTNTFFNDIYKRLDTWYNNTYTSLPETSTHEKTGLDILIKCRETILYSFQKKEAVTRTILWDLLKSNTKIAFGEFNDFIGSYPWGKSKNASFIDGKYTAPKIAQAVTSIYDEMIRMAGEAERTTRLFKGQQEQYELIVK
ncbi:MAG: hypothetical protein KF862_01420 [Chitinophagaceae bacterium]|nr:hypothetical protein [Chitinophagaceae bacterium]